MELLTDSSNSLQDKTIASEGCKTTNPTECY